MKRSITLKIVLITAVALLMFLAATLPVINNINIKSAENTAASILSIYEKQIDGKALSDEQYKQLVVLEDEINDIRISIIGLDGKVIADTAVGEISESHADRNEILEAMEGGIGRDIRKSATVNERYIYLAKLINQDSAQAVILRISLPVSSMNRYLISAVTAMAVILLIVLVAVIFFARQSSKSIMRPIELIKNKLLTVGIKDKDNPIVLTKYDEMNIILEEIEQISSTLNASIIDYQSEQEKLKFILENVDQGILALDKNNNIVLANSLAADIFGAQLCIGSHISKTIRNQQFFKNIDQSVKDNKMLAYDYTNKTGKVLQVKMLPIISDTISVIIVIYDVSDLRKLQVKKQEFFQNASHELNTPLSSILGYSEMLLLEDSNNKAFVEVIYKEAERMRLLIADMLKISELENEKEISDEPLDLKKLIENAILSYKPKLEDKSIRMLVELESCSIFANNEKITEVISNLIDNAIKYSGDNSDITVTLKKITNRAVLSVKDNGVGIAAQYHSRVFERFFRVDKGRSAKEKGTGLGLAIVKHVCSHYNATISLKSQEGAGTEITVSFRLL